MSYREHSLQATCVSWFRLQWRSYGTLFFAVPNGAKRSKWEYGQLHAEGLTKGVADTLLLVARHGYHGLAIEFKVEQEYWSGGTRTKVKTYQRPEQRDWQKAVEAQGYHYAVIRTFEEFQTLMTWYLQEPPTDANAQIVI